MPDQSPSRNLTAQADTSLQPVWFDNVHSLDFIHARSSFDMAMTGTTVRAEPRAKATGGLPARSRLPLRDAAHRE